MAFINVNELWKSYPGVWPLKGISFEVAQGRAVGVLGQNGSGKSTLFRILAGLTKPSEGKLLIDGQEPGIETKQFTAYMPELDPFYSWMTVDELLKFVGKFYPSWDASRAAELTAFLELPTDRQVGALSRGQKGRLKVITAFSWSSKLVLMDEPLGGIDQPSRKKMLDVLFNQYRQPDQTILMSTHLVDEVEPFLDDVVFILDGEITLAGDAQQLRDSRNQSLSEIFEEVAI
jgi:ABC-2 type transport system ATP-binding protein